MGDETITEGYEQLVDREVTWQDAVVDDVGYGFIPGVIGGFPYHLVKGLRQDFGFGTALRLACHKAPHVGSALVGFNLACHAGLFVDWSIRGKDDFYNIFFSFASGGAALRAKHGIISASRSALCIGTLSTLAVAWNEQLKKRTDQQDYLANTNRRARGSGDPTHCHQ